MQCRSTALASELLVLIGAGAPRVGWALFGGFIATFWSVSGITVSFVGSGWYSYIKLMEGSKKKPQVVLPVAAAPATTKDNS